ncbi:MAG: hypothetical protein ABIJ56_04535, partial [Pseudomonadota bacterium]
MRAPAFSLLASAFILPALSCQWIAGVEKKELPAPDAGPDLDVVQDEAAADAADRDPDTPGDGSDVEDLADIHETPPDPDAADTGDAGPPEGLKGLGEPCSDPDECASLNCVDEVCCDAPCNARTCERCDGFSHLGAGRCGYVNSSSEDPDEDCSHAECAWGRCIGNDFLCGYYIEGKQDCGLCKSCDGAASTACRDIASGRDDYDECGGASCCGYCDGDGGCAFEEEGAGCSGPGDPCDEAHHACDGEGACTAPLEPAGDRCMPCPSEASSCAQACADDGYDGCLGAEWHDGER